MGSTRMPRTSIGCRTAETSVNIAMKALTSDSAVKKPMLIPIGLIMLNESMYRCAPRPRKPGISIICLLMAATLPDCRSFISSSTVQLR